MLNEVMLCILTTVTSSTKTSVAHFLLRGVLQEPPQSTGTKQVQRSKTVQSVQRYSSQKSPLPAQNVSALQVSFLGQLLAKNSMVIFVQSETKS